MVKQAAANGYTGKIMTFTAGTAARTGLIPTNLLNGNLFQVTPCAPYASTDPIAVKFDADYKAKFGAEPDDTVQVPWYDGLYLFKNAVEAAKSDDSSKVAAELETVDYKGVCGDEQSDANHNLVHSVGILSFPGGKTTQVALQTNLKSPF